MQKEATAWEKIGDFFGANGRIIGTFLFMIGAMFALATDSITYDTFWIIMGMVFGTIFISASIEKMYFIGIEFEDEDEETLWDKTEDEE